MSLYAAVLTAGAANPYHHPSHSSAPLDVLLATIGSVVLLVVVAVPAAMARSREDRELAAAAPPSPDGS